MTTPNVSIRKADFSTGTVRPSAEGVLAIIAPSEKGELNRPSTYTKARNAFEDYGYGTLVEFAAYDMREASKPVVLVRADASTDGAYGTVAVDGEPDTGASAITAGTTKPVDDLAVVVEFLNDGTVGTTGITYRESLNGGKTWSEVKALGTLTTLTIPDSGVSFALGAGDVAEGETVTVTVTGPRVTNADLPAALEALRVTRVPWEIVLIDCVADDDTVALLDAWIQELEAGGRFRHAIVNARMRDLAGEETEAEYRDALQAIFGATATIRVCVGADGGDLISLIRGVRQVRPTSLGLAARAMAHDVSVAASYVTLGPVDGYSITDERGGPKYHDEDLFPGLDDLRFATLRTLEGEEGVYITNPRILSPSGSDYKDLQHARVMNRACEIAYQLLVRRLGAGVRKQRKPAANGEVYILEEEALDIEGLVNAGLARAMRGRVSDCRFVLSRTDDLASNDDAELTGEIRIAGLAYVKKFSVAARFVRSV